MTHDPDILAITRARRQQGRCLHCARRTPRAALCMTCRQTRRYCPNCEQVWEPDRMRRATDGRSSDYCPPCNRHLKGYRQTEAERNADRRSGTHARLATIIQLYREGLALTDIAAATGLTMDRVCGIVAYARRTGRWPTGLMRHPRRQR